MKEKSSFAYIILVSVLRIFRHDIAEILLKVALKHQNPSLLCSGSHLIRRLCSGSHLLCRLCSGSHLICQFRVIDTDKSENSYFFNRTTKIGE